MTETGVITVFITQNNHLYSEAELLPGLKLIEAETRVLPTNILTSLTLKSGSGILQENRPLSTSQSSASFRDNLTTLKVLKIRFKMLQLVRQMSMETRQKCTGAYLSPSPSDFSKMIGSLSPPLWTNSYVKSAKEYKCKHEVERSSISWFQCCRFSSDDGLQPGNDVGITSVCCHSNVK